MRIVPQLRVMRAVHKISARKVRVEFPLLDLPNELIAHIIEHVDKVQELRRLARTCRRLQKLAEPVLYRSVLIRVWDDAEQVLRALYARSERSMGIRFLDIPCDGYYEQNFAALCEIMTMSSNVRELMIESPQCNSCEFENENKDEWSEMASLIFKPFQMAVNFSAEAQMSPRPLQILRSLTLHLNGPESPYWEFDHRSITILLHPTLQHLRISCVNILGNMQDHLHGRSSSPLRHLELDECNITHSGLTVLLSIPQALETLYLGENCHNVRVFDRHEVNPACNHLFQVNPLATSKALRQQRASLTSLTYVTTETYYQHQQLLLRANMTLVPLDGGFADFEALKEVTLIGSCPLFERAFMTSRSPPNLHTLRFKSISPFYKDTSNPSDHDSPFALVPFFRAPSCSIPRGLTHLEITYDDFPFSGRSRLSDKAKQIIEVAAKAALKVGAGVDMTVSARGTDNYIPPFLWNEPKPVEALLYGGVDLGFLEPPQDVFRRRWMSLAELAELADDDHEDFV